MTAPIRGPFIVRAIRTDATLPPEEEPFSRYGPARDRAEQIASALSYRTAMVVDRNGAVYVQFFALWAIPRDVR